MDIDVFLRKYFEQIKYEKVDGGYELAFPFKLYNDDHISSCFITQESTGVFLITDNGNIFKYFENNGVKLEDYPRQIKQICKMFGLFIEDGLVKKILGEYETNLTFIQMTNFFLGISHLATLRLLF